MHISVRAVSRVLGGRADVEVGPQELSQRATPGYAIGGLAGGEDKASFCRCAPGSA